MFICISLSTCHYMCAILSKQVTALFNKYSVILLLKNFKASNTLCLLNYTLKCAKMSQVTRDAPLTR